ncbi:MAG: carbohydrate porin [Bacteroidetes bacterium]|nr:carbohydrate porin [Bacteroidota bacterium]
MKFIISTITALLLSCTLYAGDTAAQRFNIHFQTTYIYQYMPAFHADYSGANSLKNAEEKDNSITATLFLGVRLWKGAELYINPEVAGGGGLSGAFGLAASTNGETFRVGDPSPTLYLARGYLKQTIALSKGTDEVQDAANQVQINDPKNYLRFYIGKLSLGDLYDNNLYSNSPRTQFMNWALMNNAAWDYAANLRGYTYSFITQLQYGSRAYKAALATLPVVANGGELNTDLSQEFSVNAEVDQAYKIHGQSGTVRLLGYVNDGHMGNYNQAIAQAGSSNPPDVISTRKYGTTKAGFGINADQQINSALGLFARLGWNDGKNETWCFTEADRTLSIGANVNGNKWHRDNDNIGIAFVVNGLSQEHKQYLADGGLGFQLGDGKLNYGHETAVELYYSFKPLATGIWFTGDYQLVVNPGYNRDRGPVSVFAFRLHVEL